MKSRFSIVAILAVCVFLLVSVNVAQAQWAAIKVSGYAVTTNWHGIDVPVPSSVVVTAGTTDLSVTSVEFIWREPPDGNGPIAFDEEVPTSTLITPAVPPNVPNEVIKWATDNPGITYKYAQSTHPIDVVGDWGVQALFKDGINIKGRALSAIRATSFNAVPEVPFGTVLILSSMFGALGVLIIKRKRIFQNLPLVRID